MDITERIKNYKPWTCPNCNKRYKNPEKEMELIGTVYDRIKRKITDEYRCVKCEAHFLVKVETKLNWNETEMRTG
jgi:DNA-directed RNA polymerase subunit RPC12/RpoP